MADKRTDELTVEDYRRREYILVDSYERQLKERDAKIGNLELTIDVLNRRIERVVEILVPREEEEDE